jgi:hypothetical protein
VAYAEVAETQEKAFYTGTVMVSYHSPVLLEKNPYI